MVGDPSGSGTAHPEYLAELSASLGLSRVMRFEPATPQAESSDWYRAANVTVVPSYNESFGLVAVESQACATPVVAASVGGLRTAVADGVSGYLVEGHDPADYAAVLERLLDPRGVRRELALGAVEHAQQFGWAATAASMLDVYGQAVNERAAVPAAARDDRRGRGRRLARPRSCARSSRASDLDWEEDKPGHFVVTLPGEHKQRTTCSLVVGAHALSVNAFVARHPDENADRSTSGCSSATCGCTASRSRWTSSATSTSSAGCRCTS